MRQLNNNEVSTISGGMNLAFSAADWSSVVRLGGAFVGWTESNKILSAVGMGNVSALSGYAGQFVTSIAFMETARMTNDFVTGWVEPRLDSVVKSITG